MTRALCGLLMLCLWAGSALGADFDQAARQTAEDLARARREAQAADREISRREHELAQRLASLTASVAAEKKALAGLQEELGRLSREKASAQEQWRQVSGDLKEMAGQVRASARELLGLAEHSPVTAEAPHSLEELKGMQAKGHLPGLGDLETLIRLYLEDMAAASGISRRQGAFVDAEGREAQGFIVRLGAFTSLYRQGDRAGFLLPGPDPRRLLAVEGEMPWGLEAVLAAYLDGQSRVAPLDISGGAALRGLARSPSWTQRLEAGGPLVWPILGVGLVALLLVLERLYFLQRVHLNTDILMGKVGELLGGGKLEEARRVALAKKGRPVANVALAGLELAGQSPEAVDSGLSEAMLKELPRLERSLTVLKVLAAVAPLLGLLGTVTGMINTFQVITVHGSGDPRLMAGGISEALITTQLGLAVAIPIMVAAALLGRRAQRVASDMEEKALALSAALMCNGGRP